MSCDFLVGLGRGLEFFFDILWLWLYKVGKIAFLALSMRSSINFIDKFHR